MKKDQEVLNDLKAAQVLRDAGLKVRQLLNMSDDIARDCLENPTNADVFAVYDRLTKVLTK